MRNHPALKSFPTQPGMTLVELLLAALLAALLIAGLVQIVSAAGSSFRLQENQAEVQEGVRYAEATLGQLIRQAGYSPQPWNEDLRVEGLTEETADEVTARSDRLGLRFWSDTNCFGNRNPATDSEGAAKFFLRESVFDLNSQRDLAHSCRYGANAAELTTQINHQGFVRRVEFFQALFGEDSTGDGQVDRWVDAGYWSDPQQVLAIRIALLVKSTDKVLDAASESFDVLDSEYIAPADGLLRRLHVFTTSLRGRG